MGKEINDEDYADVLMSSLPVTGIYSDMLDL